MKIFLILMIVQVFLSKDISIKDLKELKNSLEKNPILVKARDQQKKERKLFTDNEFQVGSAYVQQLQNTNTNLNEMMGHSQRQEQLKKMSQWFLDVEEKLDGFRNGVSRKLNELHMSLQRPKIPSTTPGVMNNLPPGIQSGGDHHENAMLGDLVKEVEQLKSMIKPIEEAEVSKQEESNIVQNEPGFQRYRRMQQVTRPNKFGTMPFKAV